MNELFANCLPGVSGGGGEGVTRAIDFKYGDQRSLILKIGDKIEEKYI